MSDYSSLLKEIVALTSDRTAEDVLAQNKKVEDLIKSIVDEKLNTLILPLIYEHDRKFNNINTFNPKVFTSYLNTDYPATLSVHYMYLMPNQVNHLYFSPTDRAVLTIVNLADGSIVYPHVVVGGTCFEITHSRPDAINARITIISQE